MGLLGSNKRYTRERKGFCTWYSGFFSKGVLLEKRRGLYDYLVFCIRGFFEPFSLSLSHRIAYVVNGIVALPSLYSSFSWLGS
jgi:hypothetical protein